MASVLGLNPFSPDQYQRMIGLNHALGVNQAQNIANQYAPQMNQADLGLKQAQARYENALANNPARNIQSKQILKTPNGYVEVDRSTGQISPLKDSSGNPVMPVLKNGLSTSQGSNGQWSISQNGLVNTGVQQPGVSSDVSSNLEMSPASPHSRSSNAGSTLFDHTTGNAISVPTSKTVTNTQQALSGESIVNPSLRYLFNEVAPDIGVRNVLGRTLSGWSRSIGRSTPELDSYQSAVESGIPQMADQVLKASNLNATDNNVKLIQHALQPRWNDNQQSYARRTADTLAQLMYRENVYRQYLKGGMALQGNVSGPQVIKNLSDQIYGQLLSGVNNSGNNSVGAFGQHISQSSFDMNKAKQELQRRGIK